MGISRRRQKFSKGELWKYTEYINTGRVRTLEVLKHVSPGKVCISYLLSQFEIISDAFWGKEEF